MYVYRETSSSIFEWGRIILNACRNMFGAEPEGSPIKIGSTVRSS